MVTETKQFQTAFENYMKNGYDEFDTIVGIARKLDCDLGFWDKCELIETRLKDMGYVVEGGLQMKIKE